MMMTNKAQNISHDYLKYILLTHGLFQWLAFC